ncbi:hypothetical protein [Deinococcus marmoris]|uniref:Ricin B lectin domain-containing protein n=1 Tax=Deinococcus marmoris TaxID=249408 RepID=A0A1U7P4B0_9DEIO|nr:hypothetical protein [Deinococcus marmoris]OLV20015.1 hypothetical protein BOO71_0001003 [Deinococcus marmoris]
MFRKALLLCAAGVLASSATLALAQSPQFYRLQLQSDGQYLDADHCTATLGLNPGSTYADGACQLWRLVPEAVRID